MIYKIRKAHDGDSKMNIFKTFVMKAREFSTPKTLQQNEVTKEIISLFEKR